MKSGKGALIVNLTAQYTAAGDGYILNFHHILQSAGTALYPGIKHIQWKKNGERTEETSKAFPFS